jgi:hypothetical protein
LTIIDLIYEEERLVVGGSGGCALVYIGWVGAAISHKWRRRQWRRRRRRSGGGGPDVAKNQWPRMGQIKRPAGASTAFVFGENANSSLGIGK